MGGLDYQFKQCLNLLVAEQKKDREKETISDSRERKKERCRSKDRALYQIEK